MSENTTTAGSTVTRTQVEEILQRFIDSKDEHKVLAIKGKWGVGKTSLVRKFLEDNNQEYYYASLFGISSIEELKSQILNGKTNNLVNKDKENKNSNFCSELDIIVGSNYEPYNYFRKLKDVYSYIFSIFYSLLKLFVKIVTFNSERIDRIPKAQDIHLGGVTVPLAGVVISLAGNELLYWLFSQIKNFIICIDDLERNSKIQLDELLGFIEYLAQELKCQVILIYNESILQNETKEDKKEERTALEIYREKVIDIEVELNPTVEENLNIVFNKECNFSTETIQIIKGIILSTGTNNIRVIKKIKAYINEIIPLMSKWESKLREQIIKNTVIFSLVKLDTEFHKKFHIDMEDIISIVNYSNFSTINEDEDEDEDKRNKLIEVREKLLIQGHIILSIDKYLVQLVDKFLFDKDKFIREGNEINEQEKRNPIIARFEQLWQPYFNSFGDSEEELAETMTEFLEEHYLNLHPNNFESLNRLASSIDGLKISKYEYSFLKYYLENEPSYFYTESTLVDKLSKYPDLEELLKRLKSQYKETLNITVALSRIMNVKYHSHLVHPLEREFLNECTIDDYYHWLKKGHPDLNNMIIYCLSRGINRYTLEEAIKKLAKESKLNKMRAANLYKIYIDINSDETDNN
ncbi:MAG TPA: P-loop NTPase fold protein [Nostocaceae cyanobacterium]|nr:P-loop NTPase fold protein [Nostocaceae cyanobacterium]